MDTSCRRKTCARATARGEQLALFVFAQQGEPRNLPVAIARDAFEEGAIMARHASDG